jgi:hypothetical protein
MYTGDDDMNMNGMIMRRGASMDMNITELMWEDLAKVQQEGILACLNVSKNETGLKPKPTNDDDDDDEKDDDDNTRQLRSFEMCGGSGELSGYCWGGMGQGGVRGLAGAKPKPKPTGVTHQCQRLMPSSVTMMTRQSCHGMRQRRVGTQTIASGLFGMVSWLLGTAGPTLLAVVSTQSRWC